MMIAILLKKDLKRGILPSGSQKKEHDDDHDENVIAEGGDAEKKNAGVQIPKEG